jgi:hypothetical protein
MIVPGIRDFDQGKDIYHNDENDSLSDQGSTQVAENDEVHTTKTNTKHCSDNPEQTFPHGFTGETCNRNDDTS